jgi:hypothetical protein
MSCESKESDWSDWHQERFSEFNVFDMCESFFAVLVIHDSLVGTDMNHAFRSLAVSLSCRDIRLTG